MFWSTLMGITTLENARSSRSRKEIRCPACWERRVSRDKRAVLRWVAVLLIGLLCCWSCCLYGMLMLTLGGRRRQDDIL